jgi:hypothetical protein
LPVQIRLKYQIGFFISLCKFLFKDDDDDESIFSLKESIAAPEMVYSARLVGCLVQGLTRRNSFKILLMMIMGKKKYIRVNDNSFPPTLSRGDATSFTNLYFELAFFTFGELKR